jgi:4-amino-4-deoxy-L-arabinose transferase-like glycosyltransferase
MNIASDFQLRSDAHARLLVTAVSLMAATVIVFGIFRLQTFVANPGDPYGYGEIARGLIENGLTKLTRRAASLYPEFIAIIYRLGGGDLTVVVLQGLMHVATCLMVLSLGQRLYNVRTGILAGLFCALHPMLLRYVADLHMETFLTFMFMAAISLSVRFYDQPTVLNGVWLGLVGMCATLTKGVVLPCIVIFGFVMLARALRRRSTKEIAAAVALFVSLGVVLAPWTYRNYRITDGRFVLLTPGASDSFLRGYIFTRWEFATLKQPPYTDAENESNAWFRQIALEAGTTWELDEVVDEQNNARVVRRMIATQPIDTLRKIFVGLFTFWYEMTSLKNSLVPASLAIAAWVFAGIGLRRAAKEQRPSWLLWLPIVVMNVFVAFLIPLGRYSVPILPCLMILAAFGVDTMLARRAAGR